jgi:hypothetical protein
MNSNILFTSTELRICTYHYLYMYNYILTEGSEVDYMKEYMMEESRTSSHNGIEVSAAESKEEVRLIDDNR